MCVCVCVCVCLLKKKKLEYSRKIRESCEFTNLHFGGFPRRINQSGACLMPWKRRTKFPFSTLRFRQTSCLDQLWRALRSASRRLRSHLRRCDTSSLSVPALLLLSVILGLHQLSRKLSQHQPPLSPDLLRVVEKEGAHAWHDTTPSQSANDPGPRSPWIQCLRSPPDQPRYWVLLPPEYPASSL